MVEEQVFVAALDCNRMDVADQCLLSLKNKFPDSLRVAKLRGMKLEALERYVSIAKLRGMKLEALERQLCINSKAQRH